MTTVKELIGYLKTLPPDTEVSVINAYDDHSAKEVDLDLDPLNRNIYFTDMTGNRFVKKDAPHYNKKYLVLGQRLTNQPP